MLRTIKSAQYKTTLLGLWIIPPLIKEHEFVQTKPRLTFGNLPGKMAAGSTIQLKAK